MELNYFKTFRKSTPILAKKQKLLYNLLQKRLKRYFNKLITKTGLGIL